MIRTQAWNRKEANLIMNQRGILLHQLRPRIATNLLTSMFQKNDQS